MQVVVALWAAALLIACPAFGQREIVAQQTQGQKAPPKPTTAPPESRTVDLFTGQPNYSKGNSWFPNIIKPYESMRVPTPNLANSPRIDQLIANGKLMLSLQDAISLALENNLNIAVQRYTPLEAQTGILAANGPFDPVLSFSGSVSTSSQLFNNSFLGGGVFTAKSHQTTADVSYTELFHTGTSISVGWTNTRTSSNQANIFNPSVNSGIQARINQPLLNGFGIFQNTFLILEAKNTEKAAEANFKSSVIFDVTNTATHYWALVFARKFVAVEEAAIASDQKNYDDEQKELQIGTKAHLDVVQAEYQLAFDRQNLVNAQTSQLRSEITLLNDITKNPMAPSLTGVEVVPTTEITEPPPIENIPLEDAVQEAWKNSPALQAQELQLENAGISVKATKNQLLPTLDLSGAYSGGGLSGVSTAGGVVVDNGLGTSLSQIFHNDSPTYSASLTFSMPIRNRTAQANHASAMLVQRSQEVSYQEAKNTIFMNVREAIISLQQDRAALTAGEKNVALAQESYDDEVKKLQLGTSNSLFVSQKQQLLVAAQATELQARVALADDEWNFNDVMSRTLDVNHIVIAGAQPATGAQGVQIRNAGAGASTPSQPGGAASGR